MVDIIWRVHYDTYEAYLDICGQLRYTDPDDEEYIMLREELQSLPGFPTIPDESNDVVVPKVVNKQFHHRRIQCV
jgi:hypothetical protein